MSQQHKYTVALTVRDQAQIEQIRENFAPFEIKAHHIVRMAIHKGLDALSALPPRSAEVAK